MNDKATLGTLLRHLIDLCDGAVEEAYAQAGLDYRPRYTPIVKALRACGPSSIRALSAAAGVTHSAASQTVAQMAKDGLVRLAPGRDARERLVGLTAKAKRLLPRLEHQWSATAAAVRGLDHELGLPLEDVLRRAIAALEARPFLDRIRDAHDRPH